MVDFNLFRYAAPPRCGTSWILQASAFCGLPYRQKTEVHFPHLQKDTTTRLTTIRHPCDWLASYFGAIHPAVIHVPSVDRFNALPSEYFDDFVRMYLKRFPGAIGAMYASYHADVYLRLEDMPAAFGGFLEACGVDPTKCLTLSRLNFHKRREAVWSPSLRDRVMDAESEAMELYEYAGVP